MEGKTPYIRHMKQEVHILIACADARDLSQLQIDVVEAKVKAYLKKDISIDMEVLRVAGSFVSPDVIMDIKRAIERVQRETAGLFTRTDYFVHIQTHGHLDDQSNKGYTSHLYEMNIVPGSPLNCGMMNATMLGLELEQLLIEEQLEYRTSKGILKIRNDEDIPELLRTIYGYDGYLAGDWLKSIAYLRTHPREQKAKLEKAIRNDSELSRLGIKVTAGILDYSIHGLIRLDGGMPQVPFWDETQLEIRKSAEEKKDELQAQTQKQDPLAGLISMSDPKSTSRVSAAKYYYDLKGLSHEGSYMPNTIFHLSGGGFDLPETPFGPYVIGGFFFAVKYLKLTDQIILGHDMAQSKRILGKIKNDPLMELICKKYKVNLILLAQNELGNHESDFT